MDNHAPHNDSLLKRIARLTKRARAHLFWEQYAPVFALSICAVMVFVAGSFAGLWERIGDPWRLIALIASLVLIGRAIWRARKINAPTQMQARRRVERDSFLDHRPFDTVTDAAAQTGQVDLNLWDEHSRRAAAQAASASPSRLRAVIAPIDKFYLRFAAPAMLILGFMLGTGDSFERLRQSLSPSWQSGIKASNAKYDAWIDPPDYTGRPPVYFKGKALITAPEGSELVTRISGVDNAPRLRIIQDGRTRYVAVERLGPQSFEARTILQSKSRESEITARWRLGSQVQDWDMVIKKDAAPIISWEEPPAAGTRDQLNFSYNLTDDYGANAMALELQLVQDQEDNVNPPRERIPVDLPAALVRSAEANGVQMNLTKHVWAGKKARARLVAIDAKGQEGYSDYEELIVPDKIFIDPLAKAIIENRQLLLSAKGAPYKSVPAGLERNSAENLTHILPEERIGRAPEPVQRAAILLDAISDSPIGAFKDPVVYMGLKNVQTRVQIAREIDDLNDAPEDLWLIAMRAEFGPLGNAREAMQAAEAALNSAIARRARKREIDTLFERYNDAVDRYMEYLMQQALESGQQAQQSGEGGGEGRNIDEIQALLDAIEEANRLGDTEGARRALAQLAEFLENMQIQLTQGAPGEGGESINQDGLSEDVKEAIEDLADTLGRQRELNDETRDALREQEEEAEEQGEQSGDQAGDQAGEQSGQQSGQRSGQQSGQQAGNQSGADSEARDGQQLARDQGALEDALNALEQALREGDTDLSSRGNGSSGEPSDEQGAAGGGEQAENEQGAAGGGGEEDGETGEGGQALSPEEALEAARNAMEQSEDALANQDFALADEAQREAIAALRRAAESLISQANIDGGEQSGDAEQAGNDPFGRDGEETGQGIGEGETDVPFKSDRQRARELIEDLRRRASEQERDSEELNYLERLLERF